MAAPGAGAVAAMGWTSFHFRLTPQTGLSLIRTGSIISELTTRVVKLASLPGTILPICYSSRSE